ADAVMRRLSNAQGELDKAGYFDYILVNEKVEQTVEDVRAIVLAESRRTTAAIDLSHVIRQLQEGIEEILNHELDSVGK
ncbi:uncharacterized protein METZ01_LOCUS473129, partial [marine metagenome]